MTPSKQQQDCLDAFATETHNISVNASAGAGKTTLIRMLCQTLTAGQNYVALCFNANSAKAFADKLPYYVTASTFHSHCNSALKMAGYKLDKQKLPKILKEIIPDWKKRSQIQGGIYRLVSLTKQTKEAALGQLNGDPQRCVEYSLVESIADEYGIDVAAIPAALDVLMLSLQDEKTMDFDDMLLYALKAEIPLTPAAILFVDEAQDTNELQRYIVRKILGENGRLILVGDPNQAIYGFRGATANAMELLESEFDATPMPLSVSYRCSQAVVAEAQKILTKPL